jgi:hypothetical protein
MCRGIVEHVGENLQFAGGNVVLLPSLLRRTLENPHCQGPVPGAFTLHGLDS